MKEHGLLLQRHAGRAERRHDGRIDARDDSPVHGFLNDPADFAGRLDLPSPVRTEAATLGAGAFKTQSGRQIVDTVLSRRLAVIIGPPGTGKTHTLAQIIASLARAHARAEVPFRALITAFAHSAIDELCAKLTESYSGAFDVQRVKNDGYMERLTSR